MKIVACSDAHLDWSTAGVSRFDEIDNALRAAAHHAVRVRADAFVFAGDLCDPDSGAATLRSIAVACQVARWLKNNDMPALWLVGNHDVTNDGHGTSTLSPIGEGVISEPRMVFDPRWSHGLLCLPHCTDPVDYVGHFRGLVNKHDPAIVISHLSVPGIQPGEETSEMPRGAERVLPIAEIEAAGTIACVVQGHFHKRGNYKLKGGVAVPLADSEPCDGVPLYVVGSLARLTFGEETNDVGFLVLDV